jgi:hypothetical protein
MLLQKSLINHILHQLVQYIMLLLIIYMTWMSSIVDLGEKEPPYDLGEKDQSYDLAKRTTRIFLI